MNAYNIKRQGNKPGINGRLKPKNYYPEIGEEIFGNTFNDIHYAKC